MPSDDDFYIAWDGKKYFGKPPKQWFLAADNRWWPPQEVIDGSGREREDPVVGDGPSAPAADRAGPMPSTPISRPQPRPTAPVTSAPPASWAPGRSQPSAAPPPPNTTRPAPATTTPPPWSPQRSRSSRRGGIRGWGFLIFLVFAVARCGLFDTSDPDISFPSRSDDDFSFPAVEDEAPPAPTPQPTAAPEVFDVFLGEGYQVEVTQCGGTTQPKGTATNLLPDPAAISIEIELTYTDRQSVIQQIDVGPIESDETVRWTGDFMQGQPVLASCVFLGPVEAEPTEG